LGQRRRRRLNGPTGLRARWYHSRPENRSAEAKMIELNPVRQRIADLSGRLHALRGYL
jgi:hypothetical protein